GYQYKTSKYQTCIDRSDKSKRISKGKSTGRRTGAPTRSVIPHWSQSPLYGGTSRTRGCICAQWVRSVLGMGYVMRCSGGTEGPANGSRLSLPVATINK